MCITNNYCHHTQLKEPSRPNATITKFFHPSLLCAKFTCELYIPGPLPDVSRWNLLYRLRVYLGVFPLISATNTYLMICPFALHT